jgi:hypothetical protein
VPFLFITSEVLPALDILFDSWRNSDRRANWWTLNYLRELSQRIAFHDPAGWFSSPLKSIAPFKSPLDLAIAVEDKLSKELSFLYQRYRIERDFDGTMEELWLETLIFFSSGSSHYLAEILSCIDRLESREMKISLLFTIGELFGNLPAVRANLVSKAETLEPGILRFVSRFLVFSHCLSGEVHNLCEGVQRKDIVRYCSEGRMMKVPGNAFYDIAIIIVEGHTELAYESFSYILEGLRRLYSDTRELQISSTTANGILDVVAMTRGADGVTTPTFASKHQLLFLNALCSNSSVWQARTNLWSSFGLTNGRSDLSQLKSDLQEKHNMILDIARLIAFSRLRGFQSQ